ncbi:protein neoxanthin-deficient 1 [Tanacetum coccineum]
MSLPSFSGHTKHKPQLLKYSCQIECRVQPTSIAKVLRRLDQNNTSESQNVELNESIEKREMSISVMLSKPILALEFNCLKMEVEPPVVVSKGSHGF